MVSEHKDVGKDMALPVECQHPVFGSQEPIRIAIGLPMASAPKLIALLCLPSWTDLAVSGIRCYEAIAGILDTRKKVPGPLFR